MKKRLLALILALVMALGLAACSSGGNNNGGNNNNNNGNNSNNNNSNSQPTEQVDPNKDFYGPIYDEYSEMTDEDLYKLALEEVKNGSKINIYATSSKMQKIEKDFEEAFPGLDLEIMDLDQDEVLEKCVLEASTGNIYGDVLQAKDVDGSVFFEFYEDGYCTAFYPKDICANIEPGMLTYGYPLYASQSFWYYNTEAFPDGQPISSWWQLVERNEDGTQKYRLFTKEIGTETAYLGLFASFIVNSDQMAKAYEDLYGKPLEYTYEQVDGFDFEVPEKNAGIEFLWRFSQMKMVFIGDGDELVQAVHNSTAEDPALALASSGKIGNRDESGFNIAWVTNLTPYTGIMNTENLYVVNDCPHPAAARLFIRWITGGADGKSGGLKPFSKEGNWPIRSDVEDTWNPVTLPDIGAISPDLVGIYREFPKAQDLWIYWLDQNPNMG